MRQKLHLPPQTKQGYRATTKNTKKKTKSLLGNAKRFFSTATTTNQQGNKVVYKNIFFGAHKNVAEKTTIKSK